MYARAEVVALASHQETAPVTIAEAMAVGRPVVATDVGGVAHMVTDDRTGFVVPRGDERALSDALITVLSDPSRARAMGAAGRVEAERRFRAARVAAQTLDVYRQVMEAH
ncbi:MAG: glycosyltransferase [Anaerolineae bacterium]|nr:glycosyltransferase [Anaerolineae bacterium]